MSDKIATQGVLNGKNISSTGNVHINPSDGYCPTKLEILKYWDHAGIANFNNYKDNQCIKADDVNFVKHSFDVVYTPTWDLDRSTVKLDCKFDFPFPSDQLKFVLKIYLTNRQEGIAGQIVTIKKGDKSSHVEFGYIQDIKLCYINVEQQDPLADANYTYDVEVNPNHPMY